MANIGTNTNHLSGTGRSFNTPEKDFGKGIGTGKYTSKPEFENTALADGLKKMEMDNQVGGLDIDRISDWSKNAVRSAGRYVKENPAIVLGAVVLLGAIGYGAVVGSKRLMEKRNY